ncbi:hypothetical protein E2C01_081111 [Portunus trituberculatus]|uniref:Uncharacterized protein n=1 Tax=Portunus trituberculatus TaxID=210409 RepID=A0A5B7J074_PORTR|nr:hypothetical protein [Portunus trituberculatus]
MFMRTLNPCTSRIISEVQEGVLMPAYRPPELKLDTWSETRVVAIPFLN